MSIYPFWNGQHPIPEKMVTTIKTKSETKSIMDGFAFWSPRPATMNFYAIALDGYAVLFM